MWTPNEAPKRPTDAEVQDALNTLRDHATSQIADLFVELGLEPDEATAMAVILRQMFTEDKELSGTLLDALRRGDMNLAHATAEAALARARWTLHDRSNATSSR